MSKGLELHNNGQYLEASEILNKLFLSDPSDQEVKDLLADVYEQLGYQQENPGLRNSFLSGAYELRSGGSDRRQSGYDGTRCHPRHVDRAFPRFPRHQNG